MIKILLTAFLIILLFLFLVPLISFSRVNPYAEYSTVDHDFRSFESVLEQYKMIGGQYPTQEQGLEALVKTPETAPLPRRWVQSMQEIPSDPWDTPFQYHFPGKQNPEKPEIISAGADKVFGTDDDASNQD